MPRNPSRFRFVTIVLTLVVAACAPGLADEVTVKGTVLRGTVVDLSPVGVSLRTDYGTGDVLIPWADITAIRTDNALHILHGDRGDANGMIVGYQDGSLLVGPDAATATRIDPGTIVDVDTPAEVAHWYERLRNRWRYWTASVDAGMTFQDKTKDEFDLFVRAAVERKRAPTKLVGNVSFLYGTDRNQGESSEKSDNEIRSLLKGEYDIADSRLFFYTAHDGEYDEIDNLSLRYVGKIGPGYRLFQTETFDMQVESGIGYQYERFFGGEDNEFGLVPFGAEGTWRLPAGALFTFRADYLPSLKDWVDDYLIRGEAAIAVPLTRYLSLKFAALDTYDSTPAMGTERNESRLLLALSWRF